MPSPGFEPRYYDTVVSISISTILDGQVAVFFWLLSVMLLEHGEHPYIDDVALPFMNILFHMIIPCRAHLAFLLLVFLTLTFSSTTRSPDEPPMAVNVYGRQVVRKTYAKSASQCTTG
ncbi:hypothetical protein TNCV_3214381 [Trichonephila clavipes]|nr:hypothetical protein TNCV_3214381 [Trichonephila clavipes]